jgi:hypothetical protein
VIRDELLGEARAFAEAVVELLDEGHTAWPYVKVRDSARKLQDALTSYKWHEPESVACNHAVWNHVLAVAETHAYDHGEAWVLEIVRRFRRRNGPGLVRVTVEEERPREVGDV